MNEIPPHADQVSPYPREILEIGAEILHALAERAARKGHTREMLDYLAAERKLLEGGPHG
ncbi:MAG: hypothetical protein RBT68_06895 [Spirochaetia bacterium]|jgi:hypothetical protein|nr:hypothetical protein [Spirochaetia bacterium]